MLDTNVISDLIKPRPKPNLRSWIDERDEESLYLSVITIGEIRQGIEMARDNRPRSAKLTRALADFQARFSGRVLQIDSLVAETWGEINGRARLDSGGPLSAVDSLIAATAIVHRLIVVSGNVRHFERTGVAVFDPFVSAG